MRKFIPLILIVTILASFLAPVGVGINLEKNLSVKKIFVEAEEAPVWDDSIVGYQTAFKDSKIYQNSSVYVDENTANVEIIAIIDTGLNKNNEGTVSTNYWAHTATEANLFSSLFLPNLGGATYNEFKRDNLFVIKITESVSNKTGFKDITDDAISSQGLESKRLDPTMVASIKVNSSYGAGSVQPSNQNGLTGFKPDTNYTVSLYYKAFTGPNDGEGEGNGEIIPGLESEGKNYYKIAESSFKTASKLEQVTGNTIDQIGNTTSGAGIKEADLPECSPFLKPWTIFTGCFVRFLYYALFIPTSYLFALAGTFFDFSFAFSVSDSSYRSPFVVQGWGIVRDFCNLFFIFLMLYIAFTTILNANGAKTKEMIMKVVLVGLFINFSLFFTKIIIDTSNILARVFYTSDAISVTKKDNLNASNVISKWRDYDETGIVPLSEAIVNKIDPQNLIKNANKVTNIEDRAGVVNTSSGKNGTPGFATWTIVILLSVALNIVGFIVFLTVGLVFIGRIVGLWVAMIFAPFAFFSYTVPGLGGVPKFGYKAWFPETLKLAFVAPIFIFFMYLIIAFLEKGLNIMDAREQASNTMYVLSIVFPFIVIMTLMTEAKKIAVKFSGTIGEGLSKVGGAIGGAALALGTGGAALAMRSSIGRYASKMSNDKDLQEKSKQKGFAGWSAKQQLKAANWTAGKSFDVRNTSLGKKIAGVAGKDLDLKLPEKGLLGVAQGGYKGAFDRRIKNKAEEAERISGLSEKDAFLQDGKARAWNSDYSKHAYNTKKTMEANDKIFDEGKFKKDYENGKAEIYDGTKASIDNPINFKGSERVLYAEEKKKQNMTDMANKIAYGGGYLEDRDEAKKTWRNKDGIWNERDWREATGKKEREMNEFDSKRVRDYRKQGSPEKPELTVTEKSKIEDEMTATKKAIENSGYIIEKAELELKGINTKLGSLGGEIGKDIKDLTKNDISNHRVVPLQEKMTILDANILEHTSIINNKDASEKDKEDAKNKYTKAMNEKMGLQREVNEWNEMLSNKERFDNNIIQQTDRIKQQREKINQLNDKLTYRT